MALTKRTYTDGQTIITAANLNDIQDHLITVENNYVPKTRTVAGKALSSNITLAASDVGAVPTSRTINAKALTGNITLSAADVGAVPVARTVNGKALSSNITLNAADVSAVPTTRKVNSKALSADISLTASDVSALPMNPESIEMTPSSSSAGHGGFIDFHFNRNSGDRTSRIIESASGVITISPKLTLGTPLEVASGGTGNSSVDTTPTANSTKMVTSGGVYNAILETRNTNKVEYASSGYPYLVNTSVFVYNSVCSTLCVRGVKDIPPTASTKLFSLPANTYPIENLYEDYVTPNGNHFRFVVIKNDGVYVYNYQATSTTDSDLNKTITWAHS